MGYVLIWIESLAVSLLLVATVIACTSRIRRRWLFILISLPVCIFVFLPYLFFDIWAGFIKFHDSLDVPFYPLLAITIFYLGGAIWLFIAGYRRVNWARAKLALAFGVAVALHLMTFWNMDLAARQQLAGLRSDAGALALSAAPPRVPDKDNAALLYEQAADVLENAKTMLAEAVKEDSQSNNKLPGAPITKKTWIDWLDAIDTPDFDPKDPKLARFLQQQAGTVALIIAGSKKPGCYFEHEYSQPREDMELPEIYILRDLARLLSLDARWKTAKGDYRAAIEDLNAMFVLSNQNDAAPFMVSYLISAAINGMAGETLQYILNSQQIGEEDLNAIKINNLVSFQKNMLKAFQYEEAMRLSCCIEIANNLPGFMRFINDNRNTYRQVQNDVSGVTFLFRIFMMDNDIKIHYLYSEESNKLAARPYYQVKDDWRRFNAKIVKAKSLTVRMLFPAVEAFAEGMARADAQRRLSEIALAMCRYRAKNGKYPEKIENLMPDFIALVPLDPFDGKPIRLKQTDGKLVIYSIGFDGTDDGGAPYDQNTRKGDITFELPNK
ncbi:MAG: hypothetical protein ABSG67_06965 [Thermoguttaceae bacterium]|jgi:hypothetical protein